MDLKSELRALRQDRDCLKRDLTQIEKDLGVLPYPTTNPNPNPNPNPSTAIFFQMA